MKFSHWQWNERVLEVELSTPPLPRSASTRATGRRGEVRYRGSGGYVEYFFAPEVQLQNHTTAPRCLVMASEDARACVRARMRV